MHIQPILSHIDNLKSLELREWWVETCQLTQAVWEKERSNNGYLTRMILQCWYSILECSRNGTITRLSSEKMEVAMKNGIMFAINERLDTLDITWTLAYLLTGWPEMLIDPMIEVLKDIDATKKNASYFMEYGRSMYSDYPLVEVFFRQDTESERYSDLLQNKQVLINDAFPGDTAVERYFRRIYSPR